MFYFTSENLEGSNYIEFIEFACRHSQSFSLVVRDPEGKYNNYLPELATIEEFCISSTFTNTWPSCSMGSTVEYKKYIINNQTKSFLISKADRLFDWLESELPEDLTFYNNDVFWVVTTSHEDLCYIHAYNDEIENFLDSNKTFELRKIAKGPSDANFESLCKYFMIAETQ